MIFRILCQIICPTQIFTTKISNVESNCNIDTINLQPCYHKEPDNTMILHLIDALKRGVKRALVATVDIDIVVVWIYHFFFDKFEVLWVEMGIDQHRQWLPIHTYAQLLINKVCQGLPFPPCKNWLRYCIHVFRYGKKTA